MSTISNLSSAIRTMLGIASHRWVLTGPRWVSLSITDVCNANCIMCAGHSPLRELVRGPHRTPRPTGHMDTATLEAIVRECAQLGTHHFVICGSGETTLHPGLDRAIDLAIELGMVPYVATNGLSADEARVRRWATRRAFWRFSVHAADPATWLRIHPTGQAEQFHRIARAVRTLAAARAPHVQLFHLIMKGNFRTVRAMLEHAHELGVRDVRFEPVRTGGPYDQVMLDPDEEARLRRDLRDALALARRLRIRTNLRRYLATNLHIQAGRLRTAELYRRIPCIIGWLYAEFNPDGTVIPCAASRRAMGRIGQQSLHDIWRSPAYAAFRREARALPNRNASPVDGCPCHGCYMNLFNTAIYKLLHPLHRRA